MEDNLGIKGTLCLVGQTESGEVDSGTHEEDSNGSIINGDSSMEVRSPSPTTSTISSGGGATFSPETSSTTTEMTSKMPTFSPTINPTFQTSTVASTMNTQDPFMPPAGAMPVPPPSESLPTYAPSTPFPTYGTYAPTYSTYEPTNTADRKSGAQFIEPLKGVVPIPSKKTTTYYPTTDGTYSPTDRVGHGVASLIQRVKRMNRPDRFHNTYVPTTPFPTFDTYSPTQHGDGKVKTREEPKRRLAEIINLDELDKLDVGQNVEDTNVKKPKVPDAINLWMSIPPNDEFFTRFPEWKSHQEEIYRLRHDVSVSQQTSTLNKDVIEQLPRSLQSSIAVPTQLISAQFLEIDTSPDMTIINQDDSYLNLTDFSEKDITLSYTSVSATLDPNMSLEDQISDVPGGAILVLIGQDENGELVRNRLMWTYTMECGVSAETVEDMDEFGWAIFVSLVELHRKT